MHGGKIRSLLGELPDFTMWGTNQSIIRSFVSWVRNKNVSPNVIAKTLKFSPDGLFISLWRIDCAGLAFFLLFLDIPDFIVVTS